MSFASAAAEHAAASSGAGAASEHARAANYKFPETMTDCLDKAASESRFLSAALTLRKSIEKLESPVARDAGAQA